MKKKIRDIMNEMDKIEKVEITPDLLDKLRDYFEEELRIEKFDKPFEMSEEQLVLVEYIKTAMLLYGVDKDLVDSICILAQRYEGVVDLMDIWYDECMDNSAEDCNETLNELIKLVEEKL